MKQSRRVQYLATFAVSLAIMSNSMIFFWTTPMVPKFHNNEIIPNITSSEIAWVVTSVTPGTILGSLAASRVSDNLGRRSTFLTSAFPIIFGTVLMLSSTKVWMMYIARMLWGFGAGMNTTVFTIYLSEIGDKEIRGTLTAATRFMVSLGAFLTLAVGSYLTFKVLSSLLIVLPVCYFISCWFIPESPYYLLKEGKVEAAKRVLLQLSGTKDEKMIEEKLSLMQSDVRKEMARSGSVKELFSGKQYRRAVIVTAGLRVTQLMTGMPAIQQYLGRIIQESNCGMQVSTALVIFGAVRFTVGLTSAFVVDKIGRRPLLMFTYSAASVSLATVGFYFFAQQVIGIDDEATSPFRYIVFLGIVAANILANFGFDTLIFIIPSEIFPLNVRAIAMTVLNIFSAFVTFVAVRGYQILADFMGLQGVFWFYATSAFVGAVFTYFVVPETRGRSLRDIQIELQGNIYDDVDEKLNKSGMVDDVEDDKEIKLIACSVSTLNM